jgi:hypothetical protein
MRRAVLALGVAAVLLGVATSAAAQQNACVQAYGDKLAVAQVEVSIGDGLIPVSSDVQAVAYLAKQAPATRRPASKVSSPAARCPTTWRPNGWPSSSRRKTSPTA